MSLELLSRLREAKPIELTREELAGLLAEARLLREEDTRLSGPIRLLEVDRRVLVQEQSFDGRLALRVVSSVEAGQAFLKDRLASYERMWDGCGCKVDHFA